MAERTSNQRQGRAGFPQLGLRSPHRFGLFAGLFAGCVVATVCSNAVIAQPNARNSMHRSSLIVGPVQETIAPEVIDSLLAALDDESYAERERAYLSLAELRPLDLKAIEALLERKDLSVEQRLRLLALARERFVSSPRAAMGVQFYNNASGGAGIDAAASYVAIENLVPGFRSAEVLEAGDMITHVAGFRLSGPLSRDMIRAHIISRDPGDELRLVVRRGAERLEVTVVLGSYLELAAGSPIFPRDMARAWWARMGRHTAAGPLVRAGGTGLERGATWPAPIWNDQEAAHEARAARLSGRSSPRLLGSGAAGQSQEPDPGEQLLPDGLGGIGMIGAGWANQGQIVRQGNVIVVDRRRGFAQPDGWLDFNVPPLRTMDEEIARLDDDERLLQKSLPESSERLQPGDPFGLSPRQRIERSLKLIPKLREALLAERRDSQAQAAEQDRGPDARVETEERRGG